MRGCSYRQHDDITRQYFPFKGGKLHYKLNGDLSQHYAIKAYESMEVTHSAFCRLVKEQGS
jgi:hypothetical protein